MEKTADSESGVLTKRDMQNMRTGIGKHCSKVLTFQNRIIQGGPIYQCVTVLLQAF